MKIAPSALPASSSGCVAGAHRTNRVCRSSPPERARVGRHRCGDAVRDLATFQHAHDLRAERVGEPDPAVGVECAAVGRRARRPRPTRDGSRRRVVGDVERDVVAAERLTDDERRAVGRDHRTVRERQALGGDLDGSVGPHEREIGGARTWRRPRSRTRSCPRRRCRRRRRPCRCSDRWRSRRDRRAAASEPSTSRHTDRLVIATASRLPSGIQPSPDGRSSRSPNITVRSPAVVTA